MKRGRLAALGVVVLVAVSLAALLDVLGPLSGVAQFEDFTLDLRQRTTSESLQAGIGERESEIVLVLFDEFSVMDSVSGWDWISPFPRQQLAELVAALSAAGARTIGLDVYLDRLFPRLGGDELLRDAIERAGNVVLVTPVVQTDTGSISAPPHPHFAEVAADIGTAELPASFETFRHGALAVPSGRRLEPSFALAMYAHSRGIDVDALLEASVERGQIVLPGLPSGVGHLDPALFDQQASGRINVVPFRIRFIGPPTSTDAEDQAGTFTAVTSFSVPLVAPLTPELFTDKIVILGTGFHREDRFRTPFYDYAPPSYGDLEEPEPYDWMYGVEVHANALQNMIDEEYVRPVGLGARLFMMLLAAMVTGFVAFRWGPWWGAGALAVTTLGVIVLAEWAWAGEANVLGVVLFESDNRFLWVPVTVLVLSATFAYVGAVGYVSIVEGREKRFIKNAFGMYLSPEIVEEIAEDPSALELGGEERPLTVLFTDLMGFTTISEYLDAQKLVALLNEYLDEMTKIVVAEKGYVDKYIGDAIMAFWNAPTDVPDHADRALTAAILMQRRMHELNKLWASKTPTHETLKSRVGIHTGRVVVGNVGGTDNINYSAVGDAVNLAARLEPANKDYDTLTMVSEDTLHAAGERYRVRELDYIAVVGKEQPVKVYELLEMDGVRLPLEREAALELFAQGMKEYRRHAWAEARELFQAALDAYPEDGPSRVYAERCVENIADPPPPDWDFVVRRTKK